MNKFLQRNYNIIIRAGILTTVISILLIIADFIIVYPANGATLTFLFVNILSFVICWLLIYLLIKKFSTSKVLTLISLPVAAMLAEHFIDISDNPISIPLLILFWLGVAYLVLPGFFQKYKVAILSVYGLVIVYYYFFFFNLTPDNAEYHRLNFINFMLFPIPVFTSFWMYEQWRWLKTLQADKAKAELTLLKSQINPHFLFNTLNNLYGLVVEKSDAAPEVVLKLSEMMRYTTYQGKKDEVLLKDEISYLENYIELHKIRYQKKVDISFSHDVSESLHIAPLLFIILLENAFKHGVEKMRKDAFITIQLRSQGKKIFFSIENSFDMTPSEENNGIGLENLKKRLDHIYPKRHKLIVEEKDSIYKVQLNIELT